jgi:hypothetical protein
MIGSRITTSIVLLALLTSCARQSPPVNQENNGSANDSIKRIQSELKVARAEEARLQKEVSDSAASGFLPSQSGSLTSVNTLSTLDSMKRLDDVRRTAQLLLGELDIEVGRALELLIERSLGPAQSTRAEQFVLEAIDQYGDIVKTPYDIQVRPLRLIDSPQNAPKARDLIADEALTLALYDELPALVASSEHLPFQRTFEGEAARAIAVEAKLLVKLKGGEWRPPEEGRWVANAVAIRGLDLIKGMRSNTNKTYDDTMYVVLNRGKHELVVHEFRMTTESGSTDKGVGRLSSMQVIYQRGLHKGTDPGYRLKGNAAPGTREGLSGSHQIVGANIHSAYSRRIIDSDTPLRPNVSLGCQVVATSKNSFETSLVRYLDKIGVKEFPYTILEGEEMELLDTTLREYDRRSTLIHGIDRQATVVALGNP